MPSAASKRNPDLNRYTQYEKVIFHITRSTARDQTSGLINSGAQKNNQGPNFISSLSLSLSPPCLSWCHQAGSKLPAALPGITSNYNYIWRKKRDCSVPLSLLEEMFSCEFPGRLLWFHRQTWPNFKARRGRRTCHVIKLFLVVPFKITTAPQHLSSSISFRIHQGLVSLLSFYCHMFCFICTFSLHTHYHVNCIVFGIWNFFIYLKQCLAHNKFPSKFLSNWINNTPWTDGALGAR